MSSDTTYSSGPPPSRTDQAKGKAGDVASTAADQAGAVASTAADQAQRVASEAKDQARSMLSEARETMWQQGESQTGQLAGALRGWRDQGSALLEGRPEDAPGLAAYGRTVVDRLDQAASRLEDGGVSGAVDDLQRFARRRPMAFLAGAAAAGFLAGRLARAGRESDASFTPGGGGGQSGQGGPVSGEIPARTSPATYPADPIISGSGPGGVSRAGEPTQPMPAPPLSSMPPPPPPGRPHPGEPAYRQP